MSKEVQDTLLDFADQMLDAGYVYWWTQRGAIVWACKPTSLSTTLEQ